MPNIIRTGGGGSLGEIFPFPLTIDLEQPEPVAEGHIWIKSADTYTGGIYFSDAVNLSIPNNSLIMVQDSMYNSRISLQSPKKTTGGIKHQMSLLQTENDPSPPFALADANTFKAPQYYADIHAKWPRVYSKNSDGVIDMEDAYRRDGSVWQPLSQKGHYLFGNGAVVFNRTDYQLTNHADLPTGTSSEFSQIDISRDGNLVAKSGGSNGNVYILKRDGDSITLIQTLGITSINARGIAFSPDSNYIAVGDDTTPSGRIHILKKQSDGTYSSLTSILVNMVTSAIVWDDSGNAFYSVGSKVCSIVRTGDTFTLKTTIDNAQNQYNISAKGNILASSYTGSNTGQQLSYIINSDYSLTNNHSVGGTYYGGIQVLSNGNILAGRVGRLQLCDSTLTSIANSAILSSSNSTIYSIKVSPDEKYAFVSIPLSQKIFVIDLTNMGLVSTVSAPQTSIYSIAVI
jgi:hypothetical protein